MKTPTRYAIALWMLGMLAVAAGCGGDKPGEDEAAVPTGPAVGVLELPVSLRSSGTEPSGARKVEASPTELRVDDKVLMPLEGGRVPAAENQGGVVGKLKEALGGGSRVALHLHSSLPYETMALVLNAASEAGIKQASFHVRAPGGGGTQTGWLELGSFQMTPRTDDEVVFPSVEARTWDSFATAWQEVYDACRGAQTGSCAYNQQNVAKGGKLKIVLHAAGSGANLNFFRTGLSAEQLAAEQAQQEAELAAKKEAFLQGRTEQKDLEEEMLAGPPATQALFQFRAREATTSPSPISATLAPICGTNACGAVVSAESATLAVRVVALMGAAFPDGSAPPVLAFEQPWTPKPKAPPPVTPKPAGAAEADETAK